MEPFTQHGLLRIKSSSIPKSKDVYLHHGDVIVVRSGAYTGLVIFHVIWMVQLLVMISYVTPNKQITDSIWLSNYLLSAKVQNYFSQLKFMRSPVTSKFSRARLTQKSFFRLFQNSRKLRVLFLI